MGAGGGWGGGGRRGGAHLARGRLGECLLSGLFLHQPIGVSLPQFISIYLNAPRHKQPVPSSMVCSKRSEKSIFLKGWLVMSKLLQKERLRDQ